MHTAVWANYYFTLVKMEQFCYNMTESFSSWKPPVCCICTHRLRDRLLPFQETKEVTVFVLKALPPIIQPALSLLEYTASFNKHQKIKK